MATDQSGAIAMWIPENLTFGSNDCTYVFIHKTAGMQTAQEVAQYFQNGADGRGVSAHYVVGLDGTIVQCVPESRGAGANCCVEAGHVPFIPDTWNGRDDNGNLHSISIEHVDPSLDNSTAVTPAQFASSARLVHDICVRHNIPMRRATDESGGILGHMDIDPSSRARCPGNYPWADLFSYLEVGQVGIPASWTDDGTTLTGPNGVPVVKGFRDWVLNHPWDSGNIPLAAETSRNPLEDQNTGLGAGTYQLFRETILEYTTQRGVFVGWIGAELNKERQELADKTKQLAQLQAAYDSLKSTPPAGPPPDVKATVQTAISTLQKLL